MSILTTIPKNGIMSSWLKDMFIEDFPGAVSATRTNIYEDSKGIYIKMIATGIPKDKIDISTEEDTLIIKGEAEISSPGTLIRREWSHKSFEKSFTIPDSIITEDISADLSDGILTITLPKKKEKKKDKGIKRISIT